MKTYFGEAKDFVTKKKKNAIPVAIVLALGLTFFVLGGKKADVSNVDMVKYVDLDRSVRATGQVVSNTDLDLSFHKESVVKSVRVKVGDAVVAQQILATLDQGQALSVLTQARGALLKARASYTKTLEGASNEEVALAEVVLKNAQNDLFNTRNNQKTIVANAYQALLNSTIAAFPIYQNSQTAPTITGTYVLGKEGDIKISTYQAGSGAQFNATGLVNSGGSANTTSPQPIGESGLYVQFSAASPQGDWIISIPNKKASNYLTNYNAYNSAQETEKSVVGSAESLVASKQAELNFCLLYTSDAADE